MIRSKLGKSKRLAALLCALLLTLETVAFPLTQAKAAATAALAAVGFGVTTAAFLSACGIYPYWASADASETFNWGDWETEDLAALLQEYNAANVASPIASQQISAFLQGATLLVGPVAWEKLRAFAEWIKTKYAVEDNQTGVELGDAQYSYLTLPYSTQSTVSGVKASGLEITRSGYSTPRFVVSNRSDNPVCVFKNSEYIYFVPLLNQPVGTSYTFGYQAYGNVVSSMVANGNYFVDDRVYNARSIGLSLSDTNPDIPFYSTFAEGMRAILGSAPLLSGITADTTTVIIPDALPEGTEYGGLRVAGLPAATTAESVIDAVQDSVGERLKTPVEVVDVEIAPGTEVDSETGAITQNPVVIEAPVEETIPALSALTPSQGFLSAMTEALQTKFPFCLPFDFMRVLQAFVKSPDAPVITMTFNDRIGGGTYTVTVDLEPWDDIAAIVRRLESMILFLGFWLNFDRFNVLNIILGQIG